MLALSLLLRQVIPRLCRRNQAGTWSFSEGSSPLQICYRRDNYPGRSATERALCRLLFWAVCQRGGAWRSPDERHKMLTCSGGAGYWTYRRGGERGPGFAFLWKSALSGPFSSWNPEVHAAKTMPSASSTKSCLCWQEVEVPWDMRAANIGTGETVSTTNERHHTPHHRWKTVCSSCPKVSPSACRGSLSRVTLWFPGQTLNYWFDILHQTITWKM